MRSRHGIGSCHITDPRGEEATRKNEIFPLTVHTPTRIEKSQIPIPNSKPNPIHLSNSTPVPTRQTTGEKGRKERLNGLETVPCAPALLRVHQPSFGFRCWFSNGCGYGFGFSNRCWCRLWCRLWLWFTSLETVPRASSNRQRRRYGYGLWFWRRFASFEAITRATRYGYRCWFGHGYWLWFRFRNRGGNW